MQNSQSCDHQQEGLSPRPIEKNGAVEKLARKAKQTIGERIHDARIKAGLRQYQVAEKVGVSRSAVSAWELGQGISTNKLVLFAKIVGVSAEWLITGERAFDAQHRSADPDPDQLESLMAVAFELFGKPEAQAQELSRAILKAAERPQSADQGPPDRDLTRRLVQFLVRMYAP
jgi:transcriptional regulator with XRE-family HTH domain